VKTEYFSITSNEHVAPEKIGELLSREFGDLAHGICITDIPKSPKQQPSVPVQFIVFGNDISHEDVLDISESLDAGKMPMFNEKLIEVEQIGAVLYVRGK
jgi:hypothetical protein